MPAHHGVSYDGKKSDASDNHSSRSGYTCWVCYSAGTDLDEAERKRITAQHARNKVTVL